MQKVKPTAPMKDPKQSTLRDVWTQSVLASRKSILPAVTEVLADVVIDHRTSGTDTVVNPQAVVGLAYQSPHMMVTPQRKPPLFSLVPIPDPRVVPGLKSWIPEPQALYPTGI